MAKIANENSKRDVFGKANTPLARNLSDLIGRDVSKMAEYLNCTPQAINQYKQGTAVPQVEKLIKIASYFNVSTDYLLGLSNVKSTDTELKGVCEYTNLTEKAVKLLNRCDKNKVVVLSKMIENYNFWAMIDRINKYGKISQQAYSDEIWLSDGDFNPTTDISVTKSAQEAQFLLFQIQKLMIKIVEEGANNGEHTGKTE